jgi:4-amino-4-deoxy-L-arabinose transferase-like glycosyltransferase
MAGSTRAAREWWIAIALAALFAFTGLANHPLQAADEPRVAGIAWEMQYTGQWLVPHLAGAPFLEHPPLFYALLGAFLHAFGASEGVARLPGAIASLLTALLVFSLARRVADRSAGLPALFALVGIAGFARYSHRAVVDPLLMLFAMSGYYAYVRAVFVGALAPGWLCAVYASAALAFWVKGPIGVIAIAGPLALDALIARRWRVIASPVHVAGVPLLVGACAAWPLLLQHASGEEAARTFLLNNGWYRIAPAAGVGSYAGGHVEPFWYYLPRVFGQLGWIALFAPPTAAWLWRDAAPAGWRTPALRFLAWVLPIGALLLSIPGTKRGLYLLPFEPPLAVAVGAWIAASAAAGRRVPYRIAAVAFAAAIAWNAVGLRFVGRDRDLGPMARAVGERVGDAQLFVLQGEECLLGALPFYTGRIPMNSRDPDQLAQQLVRTGARFLLAPSSLRERVARELGGGRVPLATWTAYEGHVYELFEVPPELATSVLVDGETGLIQD